MDGIKELEKKESQEIDELLNNQKAERKALKEEQKRIRKEEKKRLKTEQKEIEKNRPLTEKELLIKKRNEPPKLTVLEEVGNSITHGVGAIFAIVALILMLLKSTTPAMVTSSIVYGACMFIMMLMSCLYHAWRSGSTVKRVWRRFDYISIYLLIGGTFTPLQLIELSRNNVPQYWGIIWFIIMWVLIVVGITMTSIFGPGRVRWINYPLYFTIGWAGLIFLPIWIVHGRINLLLWILIGGVVYTLGMIPFAKRGLKGAHFIWHFFVLAGAFVQWLGIYLLVFCA